MCVCDVCVWCGMYVCVCVMCVCVANLGPTEILWTQAGVDNRPGHDAVDKIIYALGE
jgi:hypothetical protein